jgi:hypothetical protein
VAIASRAARRSTALLVTSSRPRRRAP